MPAKLTSLEFIQRATKIHKNLYIYSNSIYSGMHKKLIIICYKHGEYLQSPANHLAGKGCPKCKNEKTSIRCKHSTLDFITKAQKIHDGVYDYSQVVYKLDNQKITILCKEHGEFTQSPRSHLSGNGCPKCAGFNLSTDEFVEQANLLHSKKYKYSKFNYTKSKTQSFIICPIHGEYLQSPEVHLRGSGCPKCVGQISKEEVQVVDFLKSLNVKVKTNNRSIIAPKELDIVLPDYKIAIEYNGLYWHSSAIPNFDKYHLKRKTELCQKKGYRLIHIFSDDWKFKKDIIKSILRSVVDKIESKIFARKCHCKLIDKNKAKKFLIKNHIQGYVISSMHFGLFFQNKLLQVMSFKKDKDSFNLVRFASCLNSQVIGGASKLFKHFQRSVEFCSVYTFADLSTFSGKLYSILGFTKVKEILIDYSYVYQGRRRHKFGFRRKRLKSLLSNFDATKSELWNTRNNYIYRIYDCGKTKYEFKEIC